jgi:hypothetical protein
MNENSIFNFNTHRNFDFDLKIEFWFDNRKFCIPFCFLIESPISILLSIFLFNSKNGI